MTSGIVVGGKAALGSGAAARAATVAKGLVAGTIGGAAVAGGSMAVFVVVVSTLV